MLDKADFQN